MSPGLGSPEASSFRPVTEPAASENPLPETQVTAGHFELVARLCAVGEKEAAEEQHALCSNWTRIHKGPDANRGK